MDYEKKYKEALNWMRELYPGLHGATKEDAEHYFPELTESEDEKTRKEIISALKYANDDGTYKKHIAWLERQKEPAPIPDKFSGLKSLMLQYLQSAANRKDDTEIESDTDLWGMKILDYVWKYDGKQKEQKIMEQWPNISGCKHDCKHCFAKCLYRKEENDEQKPAEWSEFDKGVLKDAICAADILGNDESFNKGNPNLAKAFRIAKDWLKSLPERFVPQPKPEWSEEEAKKAAEDYADEFPGMTHAYNDFLAGVLWAKHHGIFQNGNTHWKPSEEQMEALESAVKLYKDTHFEIHHKKIVSLYEQLKKLM